MRMWTDIPATKHTAYKIKTMQVASKDTFFKTPVHFGGGQGIGMSLLEMWRCPLE